MSGSTPGRPIGISILAVLCILGGALGLLVSTLVLPLAVSSAGFQQLMARMGIPPGLLFVSLVLLFGLSLASGIGMWWGRSWGWFLGSFYFLYAVFRNLNALLLIMPVFHAFGPGEHASHSPGFYFVKHGLRALISLLIYLYFFKANVRAYFRVADMEGWKPVLAQLGISTALWLLSGGPTAMPSATSDPQRLDKIADVYNRGDILAAVDQLQSYVNSYPRDALAWTLLGNGLSNLDQQDEALRAFDYAIEINPRRLEAINGQGAIYSERKDYDRAVKSFQQVLEIDPKNGRAYSSLNIVKLKQHKDKQALRYALQAWALDHNNAMFASNLAIAYHYNGDVTNRDRMAQIAKTLGYPKMAMLEQIFSGQVTIRDQAADAAGKSE